MMDVDYSLIEIALSSMPVDDLDDAHDDDYLIVMTKLEPLIDDVVLDDDGVSLWSS